MTVLIPVQVFFVSFESRCPGSEIHAVSQIYDLTCVPILMPNFCAGPSLILHDNSTRMSRNYMPGEYVRICACMECVSWKKKCYQQNVMSLVIDGSDALFWSLAHFAQVTHDSQSQNKVKSKPYAELSIKVTGRPSTHSTLSCLEEPMWCWKSCVVLCKDCKKKKTKPQTMLCSAL